MICDCSFKQWEQSEKYISVNTRKRKTTTYRFFEVRDKVVPVLVLLQTSEGHFCSGNVLGKRELVWGNPHLSDATYLLGVLKVLE